TLTLIPTILPANATNRTVTWESSAPDIATVAYGFVTAHSAGSATITVTTNDGGFTATCEITVTPDDPDDPDVNVTGVTLSQNTAILEIGEILMLNETVSPPNATNKAVTWDVGNTAIATVDNGLVTAISAGTTTVNVITVDGGFSASCEITVVPDEPDNPDEPDEPDNPDNVPVTDVTVDPTTAILTAEETQQLTPTITPANATNKNVTYESNNTAVATVNANGLITAVAVGNATITVKTADGAKTATCAVTVTAATVPVTGVTVSPTTANLTVNQTQQLTPTIAPSNATNKNVTYESNNTAVATVNASGLITAVSAGNATITVKTADGAKTATCAVTVTAAETWPKNYVNTDIGWFKIKQDSTLVHPDGTDLFKTTDCSELKIYSNGWIRVKFKTENYPRLMRANKTYMFNVADVLSHLELYDEVLKQKGFGWISTKEDGSNFYQLVKLNGTVVIEASVRIIEIAVDLPGNRFVLTRQGGTTQYVNFSD
ncbi:MAG: Ig-like domain-containing protein, partial [Bacteroidales bacterium]|nr:Ig-like domain-containing protein [Bacteroidales bacterium]